MHGFRDNEVLLQAGYDVVVISPPEGASSYFTWRILKGQPRLYIHVQLTLFVYLERFKRYLTFLIWLGFTYWVRNFGGFWVKLPPKRQIREKHLLGEQFLTPNCVCWAIMHEIISIHLACAGAQAKKGSKEGRKEEKSQEVYISRICGATPRGRISTKFGTYVRLTDVIKRAKFHRYNFRGFGDMRCWSFHVAIGNQGRPYHSAKCYRPAGDEMYHQFQSLYFCKMLWREK